MSADNHKSTPQVHAPRTAEQLVAGATSGHVSGYGRRSARGHGYELRGLSYVPVSRLHEGRFGRMFRLPPSVPSDERIAQIAELMTENATDLTFDPVSSLDRQNDPDALTNFRSPRFDLDCGYGRGPVDDPFLYDKDSGGEKLLIGHHDDEDDLPRNRRRPPCSAIPATTRTPSSASRSSPCSRQRGGRPRARRSDAAAGQRDRVRGGPADRAVALPVNGGARLPAALGRCRHARQRAGRERPLSHPAGCRGTRRGAALTAARRRSYGRYPSTRENG